MTRLLLSSVAVLVGAGFAQADQPITAGVGNFGVGYVYIPGFPDNHCFWNRTEHDNLFSSIG